MRHESLETVACLFDRTFMSQPFGQGLYKELADEGRLPRTRNAGNAGQDTQWKIDISYIQKAVNQWAAAIHAADPNVLVTNGSQTMDYRTKYTDAALMAAGGASTGTLDFYQVHFYPSNGQGNNVFANDRAHWGLDDKPLVIGEFSIDGTSPVAGNQSGTYLYDQGYDGAWAWAYTADDKWPSMQAPMQALFNAHSDVGDCQ